MHARNAFPLSVYLFALLSRPRKPNFSSPRRDRGLREIPRIPRFFLFERRLVRAEDEEEEE